MTDPVDYTSTLKPSAVETPLDLRFFRPAAFTVVKAVLPTSLTPNHLTLASIATGLAGAALSASPRRDLRAVGALLGVAYGVLDCADGQLARARGSSSRVGRILDGASDYVVGVATGLAIARHLERTRGRGGRRLAWAGIASVLVQGTLFDHAKNRYLSRTRAAYREGDDLEETLAELEALRARGGPALERALLRTYAIFLRAQGALGGAKPDPTAPPLTGKDAERLARVAKAFAWLGPSTHVALLAVAALADRVDLYVWARLVPGNVAAAALSRALRGAEHGSLEASVS